MTLVSGYFDDGVDAEKTSDSLHEKGWAEALRVIDRPRLRNAYPHDVAVDGTSGEPVATVHDESEPGEAVEDMLTVDNIQTYLENEGLPEEEALFYARRLHDGGSLFLWEGDDDLAEQVLELMKAHNAIVVAEK